MPPVVAPPPEGGPLLPPWAREIVIPIVAVILLVGAWEAVVVGFGVPEFILPAPSVIWSETAKIAPVVWNHTLATLGTTMLGFVASIAISLPLAVAITASPIVSAAIYPLLVITQSVPKVALAPVLIVSLGANEVPRVIVTFLVAFFPLVVSTTAGLLATPPELVELGRSCRASRLQEMMRIRFPFAIPFVFGGLKVAIALSVVGAVVAEFVGADRGLGYLIQTSMAFFRTPLAYGAVIILGLLGIVLFQVVELIERIFFPWSNSHEKVVV